MSRKVRELTDDTAEYLAYAVAVRAGDYTYAFLNLGEGAEAEKVVLVAAQKLSATQRVQRVLDGAMARASHDLFAWRLLTDVENRSCQAILQDFSHVDVPALQHAFVARMRERYRLASAGRFATAPGWRWNAFRRWVQISPEDQAIEQDFWRDFIGSSRKKLAQAISFIFPGHVVWHGSPVPDINAMYPLKEFEKLLDALPEGEDLDQSESESIDRMRNLLKGQYSPVPGGKLHPILPSAGAAS
jgi:hypothetical protein